MEAIST